MSTAAIPVHVALVDSTGTVAASDLAEVAGALNEQVQADFAPRWHVKATVGAYPTPPPGTWRIDLVHSTGQPGALGFHADANHQPFAKVAIDVGEWTVSAPAIYRSSTHATPGYSRTLAAEFRASV